MWVVKTSEGLILHDTAFDYMVQDQVVGGLKKLGLDPADIKYIIISHGHNDHYLGARYLQDTYKAHVLASKTDWDFMEKDNTPADKKPRRDMVVEDGSKLTLGDTTLTMYVTPGDPHPFVSKDAVIRQLTLVGECADAQLAWAGKQSN